MKCPECGNEITAEMQEMGLCYECGFSVAKYEKIKQQEKQAREAEERRKAEEARQLARQQEIERWKNAHPDANGQYYEYRTIRIVDNDSGQTDVYHIERTLNQMGYEGWRLVTALTNEIGKTSHTSGYAGITSGTNATIDEVILIFERVVRV